MFYNEHVLLFIIRKRLRKTLFHERKKCLCVGMNEHSVLLKHRGGWRGPCQPKATGYHSSPLPLKDALSLTSWASFLQL
jgi:hypothetical protein